VGLADHVVDEPPPGRGRHAWQERFEEIIGQGLAGHWINASAAWGVRPTNRKGAELAAERCGITLETRVGNGALFVRIKGPHR
jgi:hypothetical protein